MASLFGSSQSTSNVPKIKSIGLPLMTTYGPSDYHASNQNFDVLIGDDRKIYFANHQGILVFDGINWTHLSLPNEAPVYALKKAEDGTIYVGGVNEFGYLSHEPNGELKYISLYERIEKGTLDSFTSYVFCSGDQIIFSAFKKTVLYNQLTRELTTIDSPENTGAYYIMLNSHDTVYAYARDSLFRIKDQKWVAIKKSTLISIYEFGTGQLVDIDEERTLAITKNGFFDFHTEEKIDTDEDVEAFLSQATVYSARLLQKKYIAICTWKGLLITDLNGNAVMHLNKEKGLPDKFLFVSALDDSGLLWVATNNGVVQIDLFSPFSIFDDRKGVEGMITGVQLHKGYIYLTSMSGVYRIKWKNLQSPFVTHEFEKMSESIGHGMIKTDSDLFLFTELQNNLVLKNDAFEDIEGSWDDIYWSGFKYDDSNDLLLGSITGKLIHVIKEKGKWKIKKKMNLPILNARQMVKGMKNNVWLSNINEGLSKIVYDKEGFEILDKKKYNQKDGLPSSANIYVFNINSKLFFSTEKGVYDYDEKTDRFELNEVFSKLIGEVSISLIDNDDNGNIYYFSEGFNVLRKTPNGYDKTTFTNIDFLKYLPTSVTAFDSENVFIGSLNAFIHIDPTQVPLNADFVVNFTEVSSQKSDSVFYGGFGTTPDHLLFEAEDNALRFSFSSTFYQNASANLYRWRLKGTGEKWSEWSSEATKDYTNLPHGQYTFEVIGKNAFGTESPSTNIRFTIATPWYFTIWAYALYLLALGVLFWWMVKLYTRKLILDRARLEEIVEERTIEVNQQRDKLIQLDDLKSRFFLNLSHELRTPLTLSMGTVSQTLNGKYGPINEDQKRHLNTSLHNSQRLIKMINEILDISKLESGKMELQLTQVNIAQVANRISELFNSKFHGKQITFNRIVHSDTELLVDISKVETIMVNLLSNAFKFTEDDGEINITLAEDAEQLVVSIQDNGVGIPAVDLPYVFDRFYQVENSISHSGTGIGLALCKELMELHHGDIKVTSGERRTTFALSFKKGTVHFTKDQLANLSELASKDLGTLNIELEERTKEISSKKEAQPSPAAEGHVLIVEDNEELKDFLIELLADTYKVSHVSNGQLALDFLETTQPDLILSDYMMPVMDGYEMTKRIKQNEALAFIPLIFLTARAEAQDKLNVLNLGIDDYMAKPFQAEELLIRVKNLIHNKQERASYIKDVSIAEEEIVWSEFQSKIQSEVNTYIEDNLKNEEGINIEFLANAVSMSERSLHRKIKSNTGLSPMQYVREYRLRKARYHLESGTFRTVSEVSYAVGFNYLSHFTKSFKERFGKLPGEYLE